MAVQVQFRRGTKAQHDAFTGATAEVTVNTTDKSLVVHDGTTQGGFAAARADATNLDFTGLAGVTTFTSVAIHNGTINNTTIGIGTSANGNFTNVNFVDGQVGSALSVGAATTFKELLVVNGDARVTGILTIGTGTITLDGNANTISGVDGGTFAEGTFTTLNATTLRAVTGVVTTLTSTDANIISDARVGAALTVTGAVDVDGNATFAGTIDVDGQAIFDDITVSAASTFTGAIDANGGANIAGGLVANSVQVSDLTDNRVVLAGTSGELEDSGNLTFDGTTLAVTGNQTISGTIDVDGQAIFDDITVSAAATVTGALDVNGGADISGGETVLSSATVSDLTDNRVVLAGTSGALEDSANLTFDGTTLAVTGNQTVSGTIDVDGQAIFDDITVSAASTFAGNVIAESNLTILGNLTVEGTETIINVEFLDVQDKEIGVASTSTASNTTADGGGFFVHGGSDGNKEILWRNGSGSFEVNQSWLPASDDTYDLGSSTKQWRNLHIDGTANIDSLVADTADIDGGTIDGATIGGTTPAAGTFTDLKGGNIQVGTTGDNEIDTSSGNLTIDSAGGTTTIDDILSVSGNASFSGTIDVDGQAIFDDITVSAASTFTGDITANGNIVGDDSTNISGISSVTASTFFGDGSGLSNTGATLSAASGDQRVVLTSLTTGTMTSAATEAALAYNASTNTLTAGTFSGSGASLTSIPNGALSNSTISGVSLGSNLATLTRGSYLTGSNYDGSTARTWAVDATSANTASKVVARDSSGNFSAGTITATLSGNATSATSATTATNANNINLADESSDTTCFPVFATTATGNQAPKTGSNLTFNSSNGTLSATTFSGSGASLTSLNASNISSGTIDSARVPTLNQNTTGSSASCTGNAATATTLQTTRTINGVNFNGSANITVEPYIENDNGSAATRYMVFTDNSSAGFKRLNEDVDFSYNPSTNTLTVGAVTSTSDIKLKENVTTIENGLDKVSQLRGVEFDFKSNGKHSLGVIAQEVEQVLPDLVSEVEGTKTVAYANLTAVLIEAVKELKAEVAELRSRLDG